MGSKHIDGHGYEIIGLKEAKTKKQKIEALDRHIHFLEMRHIEVSNSVEKMKDKLMYPKLYNNVK